MKGIEITGIYENNGNEYVDFFYNGITYRWYTNESKFSKLYYLPGDFSKAVRGKERKAVMEALVKMVENMKAKENKNVVSITEIIEARKEQEKFEQLAAFFFSMMDGQSTTTMQAALDAAESGDKQRYLEITEPLVRRMAIKDVNTK